MTAKHNCSGTAYEVTGFHRCFRNATVERDGEWWCWQHDPERVAEEAVERRAAWEAEADREATRRARRALNARLGPLVTEELAALLEYLAEGIDCLAPTEPGVPTPTKTDNARATAARIREILDEH